MKKAKLFSEKDLELIQEAIKASEGSLWDEFWDNEMEELLDWYLTPELLAKGVVENSYGEEVRIDPYLRRRILQEALLCLWEMGNLKLPKGGNGR